MSEKLKTLVRKLKVSLGCNELSMKWASEIEDFIDTIDFRDNLEVEEKVREFGYELAYFQPDVSLRNDRSLFGIKELKERVVILLSDLNV